MNGFINLRPILFALNTEFSSLYNKFTLKDSFEFTKVIMTKMFLCI